MANTRKKKDGAGGGRKQPVGDGAARRPRRTAKQRRREEAASGALEAAATPLAELPPEVAKIAEAISGDGGAVLGAFRDPLSGRPLLLAALPLDKVEPTPYQRTVSPAHVDRLADAIARTGAYLDPIIVFRDELRANGAVPYHTPNGGHRTEAMRKMGARAITALVVPDASIAWRILALNTEKAHNLKERALEVSRMAHALEALGGRESDYAAYFEEPALLTIGIAYDKHPRLSGSAWHPIIKRLERFLDEPLDQALALRERHADDLLALDEKVSGLAEALRARGLQSPYLRTFVVARINPLRFVPRGRAKEAEASPPPDWDATFEKMRRAVERFDVDRIHPGDLAHATGAPEEAD